MASYDEVRTALDAWVTVFRPQLPPGPEVAAYISQADEARHYSNRGPLVRLLEDRLADAFGIGSDALRLTSTGTSAIEAAILATAGPATVDRPLALVPSYTFAATALAAQRCGYCPVFTDIDPATWCLTPELAAAHPGLADVGVILPVAAYGRMPDIRGFERLSAKAGVPVVVDAAASSEAMMDNPALASATVPIALSFHATKTYSTGEGGAVIWTDPDGPARVEQASNFGFSGSRECRGPGLNAKMSEYHAAVGLAMLDRFADRRAAYCVVTDAWRAAMADVPGRLLTAPDLASVYVVWEALDAATMEAAGRALLDAKIEVRRWYETGLHVQPYFTAGGKPSDLPVTADVSARALGLPMSHDLPRAVIDRVAAIIRAQTDAANSRQTAHAATSA